MTKTIKCLLPNFAKFEDGLLPVVVQSTTGKVLMLAYTNEQAYWLTLKTGEAHYWSRTDPTRQPWHKGATSGHVQHILQVLVDCDGDTLQYVVEQTGAACHTGQPTCFYRDVLADVGSNEAITGSGRLAVSAVPVLETLLPEERSA